MKKTWFACLAVGFLGGCPKIDVDEGEVGPPGPTVEFDPANKIIPFPNNLLLDPATGKLNLPEGCNPNGGMESATAKALREGVLNQLDGFGTFKTTINVTFTEAPDPASFAGHVALYKITDNPGDSIAIPVIVVPGQTARFDETCTTPTLVEQLTFIPAADIDGDGAGDLPIPLDGGSTYVVGITEGVKTANGADFLPSFVWGIVRSVEPPVTIENGVVTANRTPLDPVEDLATLQGIDLLWKAHEGPLKFLQAKGQAQNTLLLGFSFNTQTTVDPLDAAVAGSPASDPGTTALTNIVPIDAAAANRTPPSPFAQCPAGDNDTQCFLKVAIGNGNFAAGDAACASLGCAAIGRVIVGKSASKQYQVDTPNTGYTGTGAEMIPGPWSDPKNPTMVRSEDVDALVLIPAQAPPANGYPVVVFQHGLGQSKTNAFVIAGALAAQGFATVAIDAVGHDSRAVRVSDNAAIGCADVTVGLLGPRPDLGPSPVGAPQCYAPFLSPNLAATRDGIRQTLLDQQRLVEAVKACGTTNCTTPIANLQLDASHITYMGQSLGGIMGSATTALDDDITAAVLNVPGVGWVDILENTQTLQISCLLVDGLIDAGIIIGEKSNLLAQPPTGTCTTDEWKQQPGYRQFAVIGRWILDPADPVNVTSRLATKRFLIQRVDGDRVVPNVATDQEGALTGFVSPGVADCGVPNQNPPPAFLPSAAITTDPNTSKFVNYAAIAPGTATCPPGNTFAHGSLLAPTGRCATTTTVVCVPRANASPFGNGCPFCELCYPAADGNLGTARLQTDAITFLVLNR